MYKALAECTNPIILKDNKIYKCGTCQLCKRKKSQEWTARVIHEIKETPGKKATFITLTYAPEHLVKCDKTIFEKQAPKDRGGNLVKEDMVRFLKRLRKQLDKTDRKIKYIYCGEYGGQHKRPHYHALLIGISAQEIEELNIQKIWGKGYVDIDKRLVESKAIKYVLGYVRKKIDTFDEKYEEIGRIKPYQRQSQGLGKTWALKNVKKWALTGSICIDGYQQAIPRYYKEKVHEMEGVKIKYTTESEYQYNNDAIHVFSINKINKNNYKVVRNVQGVYTKEIRRNQYKQRKRSIENDRDTYTDWIIDYKYWLRVLDKEYRTGYKEHYRLYKEYRLIGKDALRERFSKKITRDGTDILGRCGKQRSRKYQPFLEETTVTLSTQKVLRSIADSKEYNYISSPFGHRDNLQEVRLCTH